MLAALVLAAGESSRMGGSPKATLKAPCGRSFAARIIDVLAESGVDNLYVVTGGHHDAIVAAVTLDVPRRMPSFVRNPNPAPDSCRRWGWGWITRLRLISRPCS